MVEMPRGIALLPRRDPARGAAAEVEICRREALTGLVTIVPRFGGLALALMLGLAAIPALGQGAPSRPWLDPALLAAAKAEGTLTVYSSTNEQEGLPLFKIFEEATGVKVQYVRASDSVLTSRMTIEFRANQRSYDIVHMTTINKLPPQMLAQYEPPEAKNILPEARDPGKRWYGVYANYNAPAYNTQKVKASELPATY
jgi:iron(III) transport system substrate-binding protein